MASVLELVVWRPVEALDVAGGCCFGAPGAEATEVLGSFGPCVRCDLKRASG